MTATRFSWTGCEPPLLPLAQEHSSVPIMHPKGSRIGIVRMCDYNPAMSPLTVVSARNSLSYAKKYGYKLYMEGSAMDHTRPIAWSKVGCRILNVSKSFVYCSSFADHCDR